MRSEIYRPVMQVGDDLATFQDNLVEKDYFDETFVETSSYIQSIAKKEDQQLLSLFNQACMIPTFSVRLPYMSEST